MSFVTACILSAQLACITGLSAHASNIHSALNTAVDSTSDSARLRSELSRALTELAAAEYVVAQKMSASNTSGRDRKAPPSQSVTAAEQTRHAETVSRARMLLDTVVLQRPWGGNVLSRFRAEYPGSLLLDRYDAALLAQQGHDSLALLRYTGLLRKTPEDIELQLARAVLLQRMGKPQEAQIAYERALELNPNDTTAYEALMKQHDQSGTLNVLLLQIRRLRARKPELSVLFDREIELLHRLGRLNEAAELARKEQ